MENLIDIFNDGVIDAAKDTLYVIPFLLVTYIIMEWIEHKLSQKAQEGIKKAGIAGPAIGALLGAIPQCGFSAAASTFYAGRVITLGTLFAVYLSTSDEMIPIFISGGVPVEQMAAIVGAKIAIGMIFGFIIDAALRASNKQKNKFKIHELCQRAKCDCSYNCEACKHNPESVYEAHDLGDNNNSHGHKHNHSNLSILWAALIHTIQITVFIFLISLALNLLITFIGGEDMLCNICNDNRLVTVFVSGIVGLIPNCAASVVIAKLYVDGLIGIGACMSGLLIGAGIGLLVLLRLNRPWKDNIKIIVSLYIIGIIWGLIICLIFN